MQTTDFTQNYFELFGVAPNFDVDIAALRSAQRRLQSIYHPDRHVGADARARRLSVQMASRVNEAFETLCDPVKRSRYLLEINGARIADDSATTSDTAFLMEQIELREALEACRDADDALARYDRIETDLEQIAPDIGRRVDNASCVARYAEVADVVGRCRDRLGLAKSSTWSRWLFIRKRTASLYMCV